MIINEADNVGNIEKLSPVMATMIRCRSNQKGGTQGKALPGQLTLKGCGLINEAE
jgi:hypothetical protein